MSTPTPATPELPPLSPHDHPESQVMVWSELEMRAIRAYALATIAAHEAARPTAESLAAAIHYPECWDTAAYPTMLHALSETAASFRCTNQDTHVKSTEPLAYGNCRSLEEARDWADEARRESLRGSYPSACVVLDMKLSRLLAQQPALGAAEASRAAPAEPVAMWQWRFFDESPTYANLPGKWTDWKEVEPRNHYTDTVEDKVRELREYIAMGKKYELRALCVCIDPSTEPVGKRAEEEQICPVCKGSGEVTGRSWGHALMPISLQPNETG